ncbi:IMPACT family protein [Arundinibacter roseus]|uniref:YigZ family protein n=1 Tax=Arundinibacter roseus TaxID=2070510 RepID=A0A4V2X9E9_9BACT|nr:YigZ family protein [Arundinibacter roseus]TDB63435.1 YigZ family protein [Arundinibacter roseus]
MLFDDSYQTIEAPVEGFFKDRGSKFLAFAYPIRSEEDTKPLLLNLREQHPKAVHHCYAYRLGPDRNHFRANDDGEPSGTAGRPILNTLYSRDLTNLLVVVVRYFGGTLLGVPGLINAYKTATEEALSQATVTTHYVCDIYQILFPYETMNEVMRVVKSYALDVQEQDFAMTCKLLVRVRKTQLNQVVPALEAIRHAEVKYLHTV